MHYPRLGWISQWSSVTTDNTSLTYHTEIKYLTGPDKNYIYTWDQN